MPQLAPALFATTVAKSNRGRKPRLNKGTRKGVRSIVRKELYKNSETYYHRQLFNSISVSTTPSMTACTLIPQSLTDSGRTGDRLRIKSMQLKYNVNCADAFNNLRVQVIQWKCGQQIGGTIADVHAGLAPGSVAQPLDDYRHDTRGAYTVLYDHIHSLCATGSYSQTVDKMFTRGFRRDITFTAGGTSNDNIVYVILTSDSGAVSHPVFNGWIKFNYTDM